ncbi:phosphotransferase [Agarivorans sp. MS3-6]
MNALSGGRASAIYLENDVVYRPLNVWSSTIHKLLAHLEHVGVTEAPTFIGIDGPNEKLSLVKGKTYNYPLTGAIASLEAVVSAAKLLRKIHDASASFLIHHDPAELVWMLQAKQPYEVICHGDFAPYNVALSGNKVVGVFDFDTAHPAPRIWDLAYSTYCWSPFKTQENDKLGSIEEQIMRAKLFCDSYGASLAQREQLPEAMMQRLNALVDFMRQEANKGNQQFIANIEQLHHVAYLNDIEYINSHQQQLRRALCNL